MKIEGTRLHETEGKLWRVPQFGRFASRKLAIIAALTPPFACVELAEIAGRGVDCGGERFMHEVTWVYKLPGSETRAMVGLFRDKCMCEIAQPLVAQSFMSFAGNHPFLCRC